MADENVAVDMTAAKKFDELEKKLENESGVLEVDESEVILENKTKKYSDEEFHKEKIRLFFLESQKEIIVYILYAAVLIHMIVNIIFIFTNILSLNGRMSHFTIIRWCLFLALPFATWTYSTLLDQFNFWKRKRFYFTFCLFNGIIFMALTLQYFYTEIILPFYKYIPISIFVTSNMVHNLSMFLMGMTSIVPALIVMSTVSQFLFEDDEAKDSIISFRLGHYLDLRENTEFSYDLHVVKNLDDGKSVPIYESDRTLHTGIDGTTGTGKTSSIITVAHADDFDQRKYNEAYLKKQLYQMLEDGKVFIKKRFKDEDFSPNYFAAENEFQEEFDKIVEQAPLAGFTLMAPNADFADEIYELAKARNQKVNRIDPSIDEDGNHKEGYIGFNPLYISPHLSPLFRNLEVSKKARVLADVMQALFEMGGKGDPYFTSLNRNITTCVTILILQTYNYLHENFGHLTDEQIEGNHDLTEKRRRFKEKYPTLECVQEVFSDFSKASAYVVAFESLLETRTEKELGYRKSDYQFVLDLVKNDLLGAGREKMYDQARGLRVTMDDFLTNQLFRRVLCSQETVDMDQMLIQGQITVVNFGLEHGRTDATAFGLFFALSFNNAVLRRPKRGRVPHFYSIDEFPVLLHPSMEECFTLFRQYKVAMCIAIQTFDQLNKTDATKYMKGVLQGNCATQFVFGRVSISEMEMYEKMGGMKKESMKQDTVSETALSLEDTSMSFSSRVTMTDVPTISGSKLRNLQFQEVTVFTVKNSSPVEPFYGKVSFLKKHKRLHRNYKTYNWEPYFPPEEKESLERSSVSDIFIKKTPITIDVKYGKLDTTISLESQGSSQNTKDISRKKEIFLSSGADSSIPDDMSGACGDEETNILNMNNNDSVNCNDNLQQIPVTGPSEEEYVFFDD